MRADLLLSSGFLAFARHVGVVRAVERSDWRIEAVCGTSSGALIGALWAGGRTPEQILSDLEMLPPWRLLRPHSRPWCGALSMAGLVAWLRPRLPARFEDLPLPLAVGVVDRQRRHQLRTSGPLAEAVAASCAMPYVFAPVSIDGQSWADGGAADRLGLDAWRAWRPGRQALAHQVQRTAGVDVPADLEGVRLVQTPRSGASFWSLGDVRAQAAEAQRLAEMVLRAP